MIKRSTNLIIALVSTVMWLTMGIWLRWLSIPEFLWIPIGTIIAFVAVVNYADAIFRTNTKRG